MPTTYAQKQAPAQQKEANAAASVVDCSSQGESLQRKADMANGAVQRAETSRPNNTGMPDNLKAGIESLSGFSMDDVRVHYNSSKPATVQALAYTQGADIHVAPGQEKCLPHEAWHVAQQMAGRVSPTTNINGMPVNDNAALEHEADVMGEKAVAQRTCKKGEFVKVSTLNSCSQMFFSQKIYDQGISVLNRRLPAWEKLNLANDWQLAKEQNSKEDAVAAGCGDAIKDIIDCLKANGVERNEQKPFRTVLSMLKKELKKEEKNDGVKKETKNHFKQMCYLAIQMCRRVRDNAIRTLFGAGANLDNVRRNYAIIANELNDVRNNCRFVNTYTQSPGTCGYVKRGDVVGVDKHAGKIRLCTGYRDAEEDNLDSKPGVLIHEASHLALGTHDYVYEGPNCLVLARIRPDLAIMNADSYEYAAECS